MTSKYAYQGTPVEVSRDIDDDPRYDEPSELDQLIVNTLHHEVMYAPVYDSRYGEVEDERIQS